MNTINPYYIAVNTNLFPARKVAVWDRINGVHYTEANSVSSKGQPGHPPLRFQTIILNDLNDLFTI